MAGASYNRRGVAADGFSATFLGHQGWLISAGDTHVLVDPLLGGSFGHGGLVGRVYPPREIDITRLPDLAAVLISHEHDDHFDPSSLARLPRSIPVYLPRRASVAAWTIMAELGFEARVLEVGGEIEIGRLQHRSIEVPGAARGGSDEWEVSPFVLLDRAGHGCFASCVDLPVTDAMIDALALLHPRPSLWTIANNTTYAGYEDALARTTPSGGDDELLADILAARHDRLLSRWAAPRMSLVCGGGWSFVGERAWMNRNHFPIDNTRLCTALAQRRPGASFHAAVPGERFVLRDDAAVTIEQAAFVHTQARARWPAREFVGDVVRMPDYAPTCARTRLAAGGLEQLIAELDEFAAYLYGGPVFAAVCALPSALPDGRAATFCLSLRVDDGRVVLAYEPAACRFTVHPSTNPIADFASGLECWATDLLALLRGELAPSALCWAGRMRYWNAHAQRLRVSPSELWRFAHPLRRPQRMLALYRRLLAM